jgi:signal peptidase I
VIAVEGQEVDIDFSRGIVYVDGVALDEPYIYSPTTNFEGIVFPVKVEPGCIFVMGDNRMDSRDSRAPEIGQVDEREILGQAVFLLMPGTGRNEYTIDWDPGRIGGLN